MELKPLFLLVLLYSTLSNNTFSQRQYRRFNYTDGFSIIPKIGLGSVTGELGDIFSVKPIYGIDIEKGVSQEVNLSFGIIGGTLMGSENEPYFSKFRCEYFQVQATAIWNISRHFYDSNFEIKAYGGAGWIWFHTDVFDLKTNDFMRTTADGTTRHTTLFQPTGVGIGEKGIYYTRELVIPFGIRADTRISKKLGITFDLGYNWIYNDKLDGTTPYNLANPNIVGGVNSYSDTANDGWINATIGLKFKFASTRTENQRGV